MKITGIICEYNPLHLGHLRQIAAVREAFGEDTAIVCVMSGNFVQRGEPAVFHKAVRAQAAVACGADLVLELPVKSVLQSAEGFARGGVEILDRLGIVDTLCFGSECGDGELLLDAARAMEHPDFSALLHEKLDAGVSYASAKQYALETLTGVKNICRTPNDILGAEYCRALLERKSAIRPFAVLREGDYHAETPNPSAPSASALRPLLETGGWEPFVPEQVKELYRTSPRYAIKYGERAVLARLRAMTESDWEQVAHGSEGLWRKAMKAARTADSRQALLANAHAHRYPDARLRRLFLCAYLGITEEMLGQPTELVRVLAMREEGKKLVRMAKKQGSLPLLHTGTRTENALLCEQERRYADLYALFCEDARGLAAGTERKGRINFSEIGCCADGKSDV